MREDSLEEMSLCESLDALGSRLDLLIEEPLQLASALNTDLFSAHIYSPLNYLQNSLAEQFAHLQEEMAPAIGEAACAAIDRVGALGVPPQMLDAASFGLGAYIEPLITPIAEDLKVASACDFASLQLEPIWGAGALGQASSLAASAQAMLSEMALDGGVASDEILGLTELSGLTSIQGVSSALEDARVADSYLSDLWKSVRDYAEELEPLNSVSSAVLPKPILPPWRNYASSLGIAPDVNIEKLGARHGTQFTVRQIIAFEAVARTAERLLATRDRRKISGKLGYIRWAASFGSKLLILYAGVISILCHLLGKDLLETQKLCGERLRRFVQCLSPLPVQPLSRLPKVKPNAPNVAA